MEIVFISFIVFLFGGIFQIFLKNKFKIPFVIATNTLATLICTLPVLFVLMTKNYVLFEKNLNGLIENVVLKLDGLSAFFVGIILFASLLGIYYSKGYLKPYVEKGKDLSAHLFLFNLFVISMLSVVLCQNVILFLISWEIMSLSSFFLLIFESDKKEVRKIGINYLIKMHICVLLLIAGFILLNIKTESTDFRAFDRNVTDLTFMLLFFGFGLKSGVVPLHTWLPKAHPVAPTHVSALMSGVMIKTGIYGILRTLSFYSPDLKMSYLVLLIGVMSAFFGILYSVAQKNYKKLLAYSSIENIGIICIGIGVAMLGVCYSNSIMILLGLLGVMMHILNHSLFKTLLFMAVGCVYNKVHTKNMEKLGGLIKKMPAVAVMFLIGSIAISAIPPLNGFISELMIYLGFLTSFNGANSFLVSVMIITMAIFAFVGTMALISFTKVFSIMFLGEPRTNVARDIKDKVSKFMLVPMVILVVCIIYIGLFPQYAIDLIQAPVDVFVPFSAPYALLSVISMFNIIFLIVASAILSFRWLMLRGKNVEENETWGCGYQYLTSKVQYSSNSFASPFLRFLTPFYVKNLHFRQIKVLFPTSTSLKSSVKDVFQVYFIEPIVKTCDKFLRGLHCIQTANTQIYLLYGVIFLLICIFCLLGGKL